MLNNKYPKPNFNFIQRPGIWSQIIDNLTIYHCAILSGMPGSGKTELASHYYRDPPINYKLKIWFNPNEIKNPDDVSNKLADALGIDKNDENKASLIEKRLAKKEPWLMVFNKVETYEHITEYLNLTGGNIICTTRLRINYEFGFNFINVDFFTQDEVEQYFSKFFGITKTPPNNTGSLPSQQQKQDESLLEELALRVYNNTGGCPVAIFKIAEYAKIYEYTIGELFQSINKYVNENIHFYIHNLEYFLPRAFFNNANENDAATKLLIICSYLHHRYIYKPLLKDIYDSLSSVQNNTVSIAAPATQTKNELSHSLSEDDQPKEKSEAKTQETEITTTPAAPSIPTDFRQETKQPEEENEKIAQNPSKSVLTDQDRQLYAKGAGSGPNKLISQVIERQATWKDVQLWIDAEDLNMALQPLVAENNGNVEILAARQKNEWENMEVNEKISLVIQTNLVYIPIQVNNDHWIVEVYQNGKCIVTHNPRGDGYCGYYAVHWIYEDAIERGLQAARYIQLRGGVGVTSGKKTYEEEGIILQREDARKLTIALIAYRVYFNACRAQGGNIQETELAKLAKDALQWTLDQDIQRKTEKISRNDDAFENAFSRLVEYGVIARSENDLFIINPYVQKILRNTTILIKEAESPHSEELDFLMQIDNKISDERKSAFISIIKTLNAKYDYTHHTNNRFIKSNLMKYTFTKNIGACLKIENVERMADNLKEDKERATEALTILFDLNTKIYTFYFYVRFSPVQMESCLNRRKEIIDRLKEVNGGELPQEKNHFQLICDYADALHNLIYLKRDYHRSNNGNIPNRVENLKKAFSDLITEYRNIALESKTSETLEKFIRGLFLANDYFVKLFFTHNTNNLFNLYNNENLLPVASVDENILLSFNLLDLYAKQHDFCKVIFFEQKITHNEINIIEFFNAFNFFNELVSKKERTLIQTTPEPLKNDTDEKKITLEDFSLKILPKFVKTLSHYIEYLFCKKLENKLTRNMMKYFLNIVRQKLKDCNLIPNLLENENYQYEKYTEIANRLLKLDTKLALMELYLYRDMKKYYRSCSVRRELQCCQYNIIPGIEEKIQDCTNKSNKFFKYCLAYPQVINKHSGKVFFNLAQQIYDNFLYEFPRKNPDGSINLKKHHNLYMIYSLGMFSTFRALFIYEKTHLDYNHQLYQEAKKLHDKYLRLVKFTLGIYKEPISLQPHERTILENKEENLIEKLTESPDNISVRMDLASIFTSLGYPQEAIDQYDKVIKLDPYEFKAYSERAYLKYKTGNFPKAIEDYQNFLNYQRGNFDAEAWHERAKNALVTQHEKTLIELSENKKCFIDSFVNTFVVKVAHYSDIATGRDKRFFGSAKALNIISHLSNIIPNADVPSPIPGGIDVNLRDAIKGTLDQIASDISRQRQYEANKINEIREELLNVVIEIAYETAENFEPYIMNLDDADSIAFFASIAAKRMLNYIASGDANISLPLKEQLKLGLCRKYTYEGKEWWQFWKWWNIGQRCKMAGYWLCWHNEYEFVDALMNSPILTRDGFVYLPQGAKAFNFRFFRFGAVDEARRLNFKAEKSLQLTNTDNSETGDRQQSCCSIM